MSTEASDSDETPTEKHNRAHYEMFYRTSSPFSNFHAASYTLDGRYFRTSEHGMMHAKAVLFNDVRAAGAILDARRPADAKLLGRGVRNYDDDVWCAARERLVRAHLVQKFAQNSRARRALLATHPRTLVEASPTDRVWGVGMSGVRARRTPARKWPGRNLLGKLLTSVRDELRRDERELGAVGGGAVLAC